MNRQNRELFSMLPQDKYNSLPPERINEPGFGISEETEDVIEATPEMEVNTILETYYRELQAMPKEDRVRTGTSARNIALRYAELLYESEDFDVDPTTKVNLLDIAARMLQSDELTSRQSDMQTRIIHTWDRIKEQTGALSKAA